MPKLLTTFGCGLLFSFGLCFAGMINPQKVLAFLDITGDWDPSLALVMFSALITLGVIQAFVLKRSKPVYDDRFHIPLKKQIDRRLLVGASLFGLGWGLVGLCPGPALINLMLIPQEAVIFVIAMLAGMLFVEHVFKSKK